jgi:hypothetical protein
VTVTRAQLLVEFPEFTNTDDGILDARLAEAYRRTPAEVWGDLRDDGVKYLAAHLLAQSPYARELKLMDKDGQTRYGIERKRLESIVATGFRVTSDPWLG